MSKQSIVLRTYADNEDTAYLELRDHPHQTTRGLMKRSVHIHGLIDGYDGPRLTVDLDEMNRPVGIEIIYPSSE